MTETNNESISKEKIIGDLNFKARLTTVFTLADAEAIFISAKKVYWALVDNYMSNTSNAVFDSDTFYYPEYCFEYNEEGYDVIVLTPFDAYRRLSIRRKTEA